ncbi:MAG: hypothetical protein ACOVO2_07155 [Emticicia sp.]|uniref:hypothetical protein n=1 Tax=Emticicia sp. TaxID=1930953 RepID=UPI003BA704F6
MKKVFLYIAVAILALVIVGYLVLNEKLPTGENPTKADELANKMLKALNKSAWDSTNVVAWTHKGGHQFVWDKKNELVQIKWDKNDVLLNLKEWNKGKAFSEGKEVTDGQLDVLRGKAWAIFCNDSYWLIAPYKVFDEGVTRKIVKTEDGSEALLVSYASGGVTPGDSYLWFLDKNATPTAFKMWVKILPIGGVSATWQDWKTTETGAIIAQNHKLGPLDLNVTDLRTGNDLAAVKVDTSIFDKIK